MGQWGAGGGGWGPCTSSSWRRKDFKEKKIKWKVQHVDQFVENDIFPRINNKNLLLVAALQNNKPVSRL